LQECIYTVYNDARNQIEDLIVNKLELVDFLLMFTGKVNRNELMEIADISIATATRTLTQYRETYADNIEYNIGKKRYDATRQFSPAFTHNCISALKAMAYGQRLEPTKLLTTIGPDSIASIDVSLNTDLVSKICRAIYAGHALKAAYVSSTENYKNRERLILPTAIFESRNNWYVRACDLSDNTTYKNFKLIRFNDAKTAEFNKEVPDDIEWRSKVTLTIGPHIKHPNPEALKLDLGLLDKPVVNLIVSEALAGFVLAELGVDSSANSILNPFHFQYCLLNRYELENLNSLILAPGFNEK